jgi:hypothetical protein
VVDWDAIDMEVERGKRDFERRVQEGRREIMERIENVEQRCREAEKVRQREWEDVTGRVITGQEEQKRSGDAMLRLVAETTAEYLAVIGALGEDMRRQFAEVRAENRAHTEALLKVLDRLPPSN